MRLKRTFGPNLPIRDTPTGKACEVQIPIAARLEVIEASGVLDRSRGSRLGRSDRRARHHQVRIHARRVAGRAAWERRDGRRVRIGLGRQRSRQGGHRLGSRARGAGIRVDRRNSRRQKCAGAGRSTGDSRVPGPLVAIRAYRGVQSRRASTPRADPRLRVVYRHVARVGIGARGCVETRMGVDGATAAQRNRVRRRHAAADIELATGAGQRCC